MIIDIHTHTFPEAIAAVTIDKLSQVAHIHPFTDGTAAGLAESMTTAGVDLSVILPVATRAKQVPGINDSAAAINEKNGKLFSFGCIHPDYDQWREDLDRVVDLGLKGIKIHPVYQGVNQDDLRYLRILERAGELGLIVITHGGIDVGYPEADQCSPDKIARAVRQVGPVKLVAAHMGAWRQWGEAMELLCDLPSVYLDTSFSTGVMTPRQEGDYLPEELVLLDETRFVGMVRAFGVHRILFGTDSPWSDQLESIRWIQSLPLSEEDKTAILGGNTQQLLKL